MTLVETILSGGMLVNIVAVAFSAGLFVAEQRSQRRELERVERDSKERDGKIEANARERITDGDGSRDSKMEKLEEKFDEFAKEVRTGMGALAVQVARFAKASNPNIPAQGGE